MARSRSFWGRLSSLVSGSEPAPVRRSRQLDPSLDNLEGRVVLSRFGFGGQAIGGLAMTGASATVSPLSGGGRGFHGPRGGGMGRGGPGVVQDAQLTADLEKLRTDTQAVISGSTVTDAQRQALGNDLKSIATAGFRLDPTTLAPVVDSLLTALADGSYDDTTTTTAADIEASFTALFDGSSVDSTLISQTYDDLVTVARNLNVSTEELNTLAADRAAIQADFTRLGISTTGKPGTPGGSNLDLILSPGFGGHRRGGRF